MTRKIACITLDVEADFFDPDARVRLLDDEGLLKRYVSIIQANGIKVTAFLVTSLLERYGAAFKQLRDSIPLEFAIHSHAHDPVTPCSRADIEQSVEAYRNFAGANPTGYRAPFGHITREGLDTLLDLGFRYDSSIFPSIRPGRFGYSNLHLPSSPFKIPRGEQSLLELPFASLPGIRLIFSLSYIKLFGWGTYEFLLKPFPLPDQIVVLSHPHDFYFHLLAANVRAPEKPLLQRNARQAFELFEKMIQYLCKAGYEFEFLSTLCDSLETQRLKEMPIERTVREH